MNILKPVNDTLVMIKIHWSLLLILSTVFLFATKTSFNIPVYIMAFAGIYRLIKNSELHRTPEIRFVHILFFSIWLPMLFSLTDAVDLSHSLKTTLPYLRFLFAAYFIIYEVKKKDLLEPLTVGIGLIISFWCIDGALTPSFNLLLGLICLDIPYTSVPLRDSFPPKAY